MQEIKPWVMLANGLDRVARKLDGAVEVLGRAQLWCLHRSWENDGHPNLSARIVEKPLPLHRHHVHVSAAWPEVARFQPPTQDR